MLVADLVKDLYGVADKDMEKATTVVKSGPGIVEEKLDSLGVIAGAKARAIGKKARRAARVSQRPSNWDFTRKIFAYCDEVDGSTPCMM
jgi:hypothetical protein